MIVGDNAADAFVAPMKAGKSTLLNAMLGYDLLPARGPAMTVLPDARRR